LSSYNPFSPLPEADRELLLDVLPENEQEIRLEEENLDWREQVETIFQQGRSVLLVSSQRQVLTSAILELLAEPIELGFLQVYPQVEGIQRDARGFGVRVTVREGIQ
jgi:ribosomal protein L16 Arg81 hydroxylase